MHVRFKILSKKRLNLGDEIKHMFSDRAFENSTVKNETDETFLCKLDKAFTETAHELLDVKEPMIKKPWISENAYKLILEKVELDERSQTQATRD